MTPEQLPITGKNAIIQDAVYWWQACFLQCSVRWGLQALRESWLEDLFGIRETFDQTPDGITRTRRDTHHCPPIFKPEQPQRAHISISAFAFQAPG